jgi:propionyl-CoA carboxylase beta chain
MGVNEDRAELERLNESALRGGREKRVMRMLAEANLSARKRIEQLLDPGSFDEFDRFKTHRCNDFGMEKTKIPGDGVVTGHGTIDGRLVFVPRSSAPRTATSRRPNSDTSTRSSSQRIRAHA